MVDSNPTDHAAHSTSPAAPLSADSEWTIDLIHAHMEHLAPHGDNFDAATLDAMGWLLERVEELTAENARLSFELRTERRASSEMAKQMLADLGQALQPECYVSGINMALLSDLCREEPDEAAKREVASMMDGIRAAGEGVR